MASILSRPQSVKCQAIAWALKKCQSLEIQLNDMNRDLPDYINGLTKNMVSYC